MMNQTTNFEEAQPPTTHRVHQSSDQLPTRAREFSPTNPQGESITENVEAVRDPLDQGDPDNNVTGEHNAFTESRPLDTHPVTEGGVARGDNHDDLPLGKAKVTDKIIGKTEKVVGKLKKDPDMHEKGELREAGGKAAATGEAKAPHD